MLMNALELTISSCQFMEPVATKRASMPVNASETTGRKKRFPSTTSPSLAVPEVLLPSMLHISWLAVAAGCAGANAGEIVRASGVTACETGGYGIPFCDASECVD